MNPAGGPGRERPPPSAAVPAALYTNREAPFPGRRGATVLECGDSSSLLRRRLVAVGLLHRRAAVPGRRRSRTPQRWEETQSSRGLLWTAAASAERVLPTPCSGVRSFPAAVTSARTRGAGSLGVVVRSTLLRPGRALWSLDIFVRSLPRSRPRVPVVPEARKKLAGGGAQRNHRKNRTAECCAPAGRERRVTAPPRRTTATPHRGPTFRPPGNPVGCVGREDRTTEDASWRRAGVACYHGSRAPPGRKVGLGAVGPVVPLRCTTG